MTGSYEFNLSQLIAIAEALDDLREEVTFVGVSVFRRRYAGEVLKKM